MKSVVHATCPHDCPDACGVLITVEDGRATKLQGDSKHPVTRGFLCAKVARYLDRVYSPQRLLYPMRRVRPKGPSAKATGEQNGRPVYERDIEAFERISWDEALDTIAARFKHISQEFGPEAILPYSYAGNMGVLSYGSMDRRFFHRLGASQLNRTICSTAGGDAYLTVYGRKLGAEPQQFANSKYIIAWGANVHGTNIHLWPFIEEARRKGAKLVVIDPYRTRTAKAADWFLQINPGADVALALGMMHVIIRDGLHDHDYIAQHTTGFEQLQERVREYTPARVAQWTGLSAHDIEKLAREYATTRPAAIRVNYGIQRSENGGTAMRAVAMLPCIIGSWKEAGGGIQLSTSGGFKFNSSKLEMPELAKASPIGRLGRVVNMSALGQALTKLDSPPVQAVFVYNSNPAAIAPNHNDVVRGFMRPDLFTAVHEQFLTDTADYADIVLPATTFFEHKEMCLSYGHYYLGASHAAIEPLGEAVPNVDMFKKLAKRMGFTEPAFDDTVDDLIDQALDIDSLVSGISRQQLEREGHVRLNVGYGPFLPFANGGFATPSGKAELYSQSLADEGLDPVASFVPPSESRHAARAQTYPLEMLARKADNYLNSTFANLPKHQTMEQQNLLEISYTDAGARNIADGDRVRVFNDRGEIFLTARVNGAVRPGVVATRLNWAKLSPGSVNVNVLTSEKLTDIGAGATFYSCLVEVEKCSA